jgi:hypothetical protein
MTQALRAAVDALAPLGVCGVPVERIMTFYDVDEIDRRRGTPRPATRSSPCSG